MNKLYLSIFCATTGICALAEEVSYRYGKSYVEPQTSHELMLINHAHDSLLRSMQRDSKLNRSEEFCSDKSCNSAVGVIPYYHLMNNLCDLKDVSHLHIGLYTGGSFVGALYGNAELLTEVVGVDYFTNGDPIKRTFDRVCERYLKHDVYKIILRDCFSVDVSTFKKTVDIYLYDAGHEVRDHEMAFTYYNSVFSSVFIAVVDDWGWAQVRKGTFQAFDKLSYKILYEGEIPCGATNGNGQYITVIRK